MGNKKYGDVGVLEDYVFKLIFGRPSSKKLLEKFLERILGRKIDIEHNINSEIIREITPGKDISLDVVVKTEDNILISIEVQNKYFEEMEIRLKFYSDRLSSTNLDKGDDYCKSKKIIAIAIMNHKFYKDKEETYKHKFRILNEKDHSDYDNNPLEIVVFDKVKKRYFNIDDPVDSLFMYLFGLLTDEELKNWINKDDLIKEIEEVRTMISKTKEEEFLKLEVEKRRMDEQVKIRKAAREAKIEGELKEKINLSLKLMNEGFSLDEVSKLTGLSVERLKKLNP